MRIEKIPSEFDGLKLEVAIATPVETPKGIIQFSHGMAEHKERYFDFMNYLNSHGYVCVICPMGCRHRIAAEYGKHGKEREFGPSLFVFTYFAPLMNS